jgi:large conductance mechanosensitive channel
MNALKDFKTFILRGNVVDLAVGIIIGAAFGTVVAAFVKDLITPLIGIFGGFNFPDLRFTVRSSTFLIGDFINAVIAFLLIALIVFFFVVRPVNALNNRAKRGKETEEGSRSCPFCFNSIPVQATRCGFCTSDVSAGAVAPQM